MMGEKPESLASWIAGKLTFEKGVPVGIAKKKTTLPFWPTELDPPRMTIGFPAYFPLPSGDTGESNPKP